MYETTKCDTFRYDTVEVENGLKANCVLQVISNGNDTHVEIQAGNNWEEFINYVGLQQESNIRLCHAGQSSYQ